MEKACAYCRVSTNDNDQLNSLAAQKSFFERELPRTHDLIEVYFDEGITGTSFKKRDGFLKMLNDAGIDITKHGNEIMYIISDREPLFKYIFVKNVSRFARNILVVDIIRKLKQKNVYIHFLDINKSTENEGDELLIQLLLTLSENESKDLSRKIRFGVKESMLNGKIRSNGYVYGYNFDKITKEYSINKKEAKNIKKIFELYAEGLGTRTIAKKLIKMNIKTKKDEEFNVSSIRSLLHQTWYIGKVVRNRWFSGDVFNKRNNPLEKPEEEWVIVEAEHLRIVDDELFNKCQDILKSKTTFDGKGSYVGLTPYASKIICSKCGCNYTSRGKKNAYFNCRTKQRKGLHSCSSPNVTFEALDNSVDEYCNGKYYEYLQNVKTAYYSILDELKFKIIDKFNTDNNDEVIALNKELEENNIKLEKLIDLYTDSIINKEQFQSRKIKIDANITDINEQIKTLSSSNTDYVDELKQIDLLKEKISNISNKQTYTPEEIMDEVDKIIVYEYKDKAIVDFMFENRSNRYILDFHFKTKVLLDNLVKKYIEE